MRFLCLHGLGTNSQVGSSWNHVIVCTVLTSWQIFENQTGKSFTHVRNYPLLMLHRHKAALRYELGYHHTYEFVEGTYSTDPAPEIRGATSTADEFFSYVDIQDISSWAKALDQLEEYLAVEGPFDGVFAFSQGAQLAATYIVHKTRQSPQSNPIFKCAVFFSAGMAYDPDQLQQKTDRPLSHAVDGEVIRIPTAHIWGCNDSSSGEQVSGICASECKEIYVHDGGHEIPGARMSVAVRSIVRAIRRVVSLATNED